VKPILRRPPDERHRRPPAHRCGPPHNVDAERSVLGAILLDARYLSTIVLDVGLTEDNF